jgi:hypothetical protein
MSLHDNPLFQLMKLHIQPFTQFHQQFNAALDLIHGIDYIWHEPVDDSHSNYLSIFIRAPIDNHSRLQSIQDGLWGRLDIDFNPAIQHGQYPITIQNVLGFDSCCILATKISYYFSQPLFYSRLHAIQFAKGHSHFDASNPIQIYLLNEFVIREILSFF